MMARKKARVAVLISGRGSNMKALHAASQAPQYPATISLVLSHVPEAEGLAYAAQQGIAAVCVDHRHYSSREDFEKVIDQLLRAYQIDFVCLAGFMRVLSPWLVTRWEGHMLNIHPSLLPAYRGLHTHARVLAAGDPEHGCSVHFVTIGLDEGPLIAQARVPVFKDDTPESLAARVLAEEHLLYPHALAKVIEQTYTS